MTEKKSKKTKLIVITTISLVIVAAIISIALYTIQLSAKPSEVGYWTLNISPTTGGNYVTPNGTIQVPMNQAGITVNATAGGWNGFMWWTLDGAHVNNVSSTIFVPRQAENSNHTLEAQFVVGTPPIYPVASGNLTIDANSYNAYNFTVPSGEGKISDIFNCSVGTIKVYVMDSVNFADWQNGQTANTYYNSGQVTNGYIDNVVLPSSGTYYLVYDNTNDATVKTVDSDASFFYVPP